MFVQFAVIVQRESIMEQLVAMGVKDFLGEVFGKIILILAGNFAFPLFLSLDILNNSNNSFN